MAGADGRMRFHRDVLTPTGPAMYPTLAASGDGIVVAWTAGPSASSWIHVARLTASRTSTVGR
jgi:hypothetical protein